MITEFTEYCVICNKPRTDEHHLLFGTAKRKLADEDGLTIPVCRECHDAIHRDRKLQLLSEIMGQLAYEKSKVAEGMLEAEARIDFTVRYGRSYL